MKKILPLFLLFLSIPLFANLRAPILVSKSPSFALQKSSNLLTVQKEQLEFICPEYAEMSMNATPLQCQIVAIYEIESIQEASFQFEFISRSGEEAIVTINGNPSVKANPKLIKISPEEGTLYRLAIYNDSSHGDLELYKVSFSGLLQKGTNKIKVEYKQPVGFQERDHGYFKTSKWRHQFEYELWPLKEWKVSKDFSIQVKFSVKETKSMFGLMTNSLQLKCNGINRNYKSYLFSIFQKKYTRVDLGKSNFETETNTSFDLSDKSKTSSKDGYHVLETEMKSDFSDSLRCSFEKI